MINIVAKQFSTYNHKENVCIIFLLKLDREKKNVIMSFQIAKIVFFKKMKRNKNNIKNKNNFVYIYFSINQF